VIRFDHINIRVRDPEGACEFFKAAVGLSIGPRPPFSWHGYWLYLADQPVIHTAPREEDDGHEGWVNHIAFTGFDYEERKAALVQAGLKFDERRLPGSDVRQIFVSGPEGIVVELQCPPKVGTIDAGQTMAEGAR
jgi:catechol 2,3-dioxygenase-like lactoylglutathione lyase family enzyme